MRQELKIEKSSKKPYILKGLPKTVRANSLLWKINNEIDWLRLRPNPKRLETLEKREKRLENLGYTRIF